MAGDALLNWLSHYQSLLVLTLALLAERWIALPRAWHPMELVRSLSQQLASKVHHPERHDPKQQRTAGLMACLLLLLLCLPLPLILREMAPVTFLVDFVLLFFCFSWRPMATQLSQLAQLKTEQQKALRRTLLGHWLVRSCDKLSPLGQRKAALEAIYLRSWHDQAATLFWYLVAGMWAALGYRLLLEMSRCWHPKRHQMQDFGFYVKAIRGLIDYLPQLLWSGWLLITTFRSISKSNWQQALSFESKPRGLLLLAATAQHNCDLGGPAYYQEQKLTRPRLLGAQPPQERQLKEALVSINLRLTLLLGLIWLVVLTRPLWLP